MWFFYFIFFLPAASHGILDSFTNGGLEKMMVVLSALMRGYALIHSRMTTQKRVLMIIIPKRPL
jgi:hypothetical protein